MDQTIASCVSEEARHRNKPEIEEKNNPKPEEGLSGKGKGVRRSGGKKGEKREPMGK